MCLASNSKLTYLLVSGRQAGLVGLASCPVHVQYFVVGEQDRRIQELEEQLQVDGDGQI